VMFYEAAYWSNWANTTTRIELKKGSNLKMP
jgi:hypothetical protein